MTVRTLTYMDKLERDLKLHWFIQLGLWEQATIHCGDDDLVVDILDFPCIRVGFVSENETWTTARDYPFPLQMFYVRNKRGN